MVDSPNVIEYEDVIQNGQTEMGFSNHGRQVCIKNLVGTRCRCLACKPTVSRHWRISYCKYGFKPSLWMHEEPRGCAFLDVADEVYCKKHCTRYNAETKARAYQEVFGNI